MTSNDWKKVTLGEISIDGKGSYGIAASAVEYSDDLYTYLRITDINDDGTLNKIDLKSVNDEKAKNYLLKPNDIVFARTGNSTGRSYFYDGSDGELVYAGFLIKFSLDPTKVNPKFMRYYILSNEYKGWVSSYSTGSTRRNINAKTYANMEILLPPRKQQDYLVDLLSPVDMKIETNNQIIKKLEELAQALYKQWFVDYEFPNENGEPYKSSGGEMVKSELGLIPKAWKIGAIKDIGEVVGGGTPSKKQTDYYTSEGIPWITPKDLSGFKNRYIERGAIDITEKGYNNSSAKILPKGSVLFSSRAPIGYIAIASNEVSTNQGFKSVVPYKGFGTEFVFQTLKSKLKTIKNRASGSTFKEISGGELKKIEVILPSQEIINKFNQKTKILAEIILNFEEQNKRLVNLRDTLLPKLISGEIRVSLEDEVLSK
ncbi:restriction endonuclease subunit S [Oceanobacillus sp. HCA-5259]|uniref:restriction endonuclease subunit S n=1 Tax=Oceanobacillus sp. HCA-5259 TaxID=3134661 RepID=UPI0030BB689B